MQHDHFLLAMGKGHQPSSLRESHIEIPDVKWEDIGGLEDTGFQEGNLRLTVMTFTIRIAGWEI